MLIFTKANLAFFSVPKTGSTAFELALRKRADIMFSKRYKHMSVGRFHNRIAPFLAETFSLRPERMAVIRNPVDQLRSWYKFRSPERMGDNPRSVGTMSFDEFVLGAISDTPSKATRVGSQLGMVTLADGLIPVHHLFAYESQPLTLSFLSERFEEQISFNRKNVSPSVKAEISPSVEKKLRKARAAEFTLHARILEAGGVLRDYEGQA